MSCPSGFSIFFFLLSVKVGTKSSERHNRWALFIHEETRWTWSFFLSPWLWIHSACWPQCWVLGGGGAFLEGVSALLGRGGRVCWHCENGLVRRPRKLISTSRGRLKRGISRPFCLHPLTCIRSRACVRTRAKLMLACMHTHTQTHTRTIWSSHRHIKNASPSPLLPSLMFTCISGKICWYSFFPPFHDRKTAKSQQKNVELQSAPPARRRVHINEHITHKHAHVTSCK